MCTVLCVCVCARVICLWRSEVTVWLSTIFKQALPELGISSWLEWLVRLPQDSSFSISPCCMQSNDQLLYAHQDLNMGSHVCMADNLLTEPLLCVLCFSSLF